MKRNALTLPKPRNCGGVPFENLDAAADSVTVVDPGPFAQLGRQGGEEGRTEGPQAVVGGRGPGRVAGRDDPGPGPGRLRTRLGAVEDADGKPLSGQEVRGRESDDPATDNEDVRVLRHTAVITAVPSRVGTARLPAVRRRG